MSSSQYRLRECDSSKCTEHTEYICKTCQIFLCPQCKESHASDLENMDHKVVTYRDKYEYNPKQDSCVRHSDSVFEMYCTSCELPVCFKCTGHENHRLVDIQKAYETKRQQCEGIFDNIRSEVLISRYYLLSKLKADVKECQNKFSEYHSAMLRRAQKVKGNLDNIPSGFYFKHRCLRQIRKMICHIARRQTYEYNFEHSTTVKLLLPANKKQYPAEKEKKK